ncbi:hypothetical protein NC652_035072 [Populus alba x Populus x berolinensis]|nr:hypothetical protein NC652_035072 [Populus alba x Populus x berolinensis]
MHTAAKTVVSKPPNPAYRDERSFAAVLSNANPSDDSHKIISVTYAPSSHDRNWLRAGLDKSEYLELNFISGESMVKLDVWESLLENDEAHADMVDNQSFASFISPIADPYELQEMEANQKRLLRETRSQPSSQLKGQGKKSN